MQSPAVEHTLNQLFDRFPAAFVDAPEQTKPLKIGIRDDILAALPEVAPTLGQALACYCGRTRYLYALAAGKARVGLRGEPVGDVSEEAKEKASREIIVRREAVQTREQERAKRIAQQEEDRLAAPARREAKKAAKARKMARKLEKQNERKARRNPPPPLLPLHSERIPEQKKTPVIVVKKRRVVTP